jgi:hypothetical protein
MLDEKIPSIALAYLMLKTATLGTEHLTVRAN